MTGVGTQPGATGILPVHWRDASGTQQPYKLYAVPLGRVMRAGKGKRDITDFGERIISDVPFVPFRPAPGRW